MNFPLYSLYLKDKYPTVNYSFHGKYFFGLKNRMALKTNLIEKLQNEVPGQRNPETTLKY